MNEPSTRNATTMITQAMMHERSFVMAMTTMAIDDETMMAMPSAALIIGGFTAAMADATSKATKANGVFRVQRLCVGWRSIAITAR